MVAKVSFEAARPFTDRITHFLKLNTIVRTNTAWLPGLQCFGFIIHVETKMTTLRSMIHLSLTESVQMYT